MRSLLLPAIAISLATPAHAQPPRVPVPVGAGDIGCSTATIMNLEGSDALLAVRAGPSRRERALAPLRNGTPVFACVRRGNWFGIVFERPGRTSDCDVLRAWRVSGLYRGPCRSGWVHYDYIGGYADWISP